MPLLCWRCRYQCWRQNAARSCMINSGQSCIAASHCGEAGYRVYQPVKPTCWPCPGDPLDEATQYGPMAALTWPTSRASRSTQWPRGESGAVWRPGWPGRPPQFRPLFYRTSNPVSALMTRGVFGPVALVLEAKTRPIAVRLADLLRSGRGVDRRPQKAKPWPGRLESGAVSSTAW
jgi:acyl-CoA reductase-like NAD-dependent aldehyde dehydrogenase